jgi:hypothetical protein
MRYDWGIIVFGWVATAAAFPGYLPTVGPLPLRFATPAAPFNPALLKPLTPPAPEPKAESDRSPPSQTGAAQEAPVVLNPGLTNGLPTVNSEMPPLTEPPPAPIASVSPLSVLVNLDTTNAPPVTPQMLVPFFVSRLSNSTNGAGLSVVLPVGFAPPSPSPPPSSSATYQSPPAPVRP